MTQQVRGGYNAFLGPSFLQTLVIKQSMRSPLIYCSCSMTAYFQRTPWLEKILTRLLCVCDSCSYKKGRIHTTTCKAVCENRHHYLKRLLTVFKTHRQIRVTLMNSWMRFEQRNFEYPFRELCVIAEFTHLFSTSASQLQY